MFCACETEFVLASTLDVVFIVVWLLLEIWKPDEGENLWPAFVAFIVGDAECVVFPDWKDDGICNTTEDCAFC